MSRVLVWFSCGAASAVAARLAVDKYPDAEVVYCDTLKYEHPDNVRFMADAGRWIGRPVQLLRSVKYTDIMDVFRRTGWLIGPSGARCTNELKKAVRRTYQRPDDLHIFGFTVDEAERSARFERANPDIDVEWTLIDAGITKAQCYQIIQRAGIELPAMYRLGYNNNNCVGCVKGGAGYWNKVRRDFPERFAEMAALEREMNVAINKTYVGGKRQRVFLDELDPSAGRDVPEPDIDCGVLCEGLSADELIGIYDPASRPDGSAALLMGDEQ